MEQKQNDASSLVTLAEYRFGKTDAIMMPARNGQPARTFKRAIHTVEIGSRSLELSEPLTDDADLASWKAPVAKGTQVRLGLDVEEAQVMGATGKPARGMKS